MGSEKPTVRDVFDAVVGAAKQDRDQLLNRLCAGDDALYARVLKLLSSLEDAPEFLESPAAAPLVDGMAVGSIEQPGTMIGPYLLQDQIGQGGFGSVFVAEQQSPVRRKVALKLIKPGMDSREVIARFSIERQALALMDHPNIARVLDAGETANGRPYFVMELVDGKPITDYCDENGLTTRERIELFVQVCHAVQHAHQKGIIHRDIKPSNVLVTTQDGHAVPKIIDFGVAKALHQSLTNQTLLTQLHQMIGTPLYMSPEQAELSGADIDTRSDIYSLGALLYELVTGTTPFERQRFAKVALDQVRRILCEEDPPKPSSRLSESTDRMASIAAQRRTDPLRLSRMIQGDVDWIVMKALEKDRSRRYATADNLASDVERFLRNEPVEARPPSATYKWRKFLRRNRGPVVAASIVLLAIVGGLIGTTFGLIRAEGERIRAENAEGDALVQRDKAVKSADAERRAKETAQKRLAQVESGNAILGSIFENLDPSVEETEGEPLGAQLAKRLDNAVKQLQGESVGDPLAVARIQRTLGDSLRGLGYPDKALDLLAKARSTFATAGSSYASDMLATTKSLARAHLENAQLPQAIPLLEAFHQQVHQSSGENAAEALDAVGNLAVAYRDNGDLPRALPMLQDAVARAQVHLGMDHDTTLELMNGLSFTYRLAGKQDEALELSKNTYEISKRKHGADDAFTLTVMSNLASIYRRGGDLEKAIPLLEETLALRRAKFGSDHPRTLVSMNNLGLGYKEMQRLDLAIPVFEEALRLEQLRLKPDHPTRISTMNNLALSYQAAKKLDLALPIFEETLKLATDKLGPLHRNTLTATHNYAVCLQALGKLEQANALCEKAVLAIEQIDFQHEHAEMLVVSLCASYEKLEQYDRAEPWRRKWLEAVRKAGRGDSIEAAAALKALGKNLILQKKWSDAESALRDSLALWQIHGPNDWRSFQSQSFLAEALIGKGDFVAAEPLLLEAHNGLVSRESKIPKDITDQVAESLERIVNLYEASSQTDKASPWLEKLKARRSMDKD